MTVPSQLPAGGELPPAQLPADIPNLLRAMGGMGFMRGGRSEDYGQRPERWRHMLDTNICVYLVEGSSPELQRRLAECRQGEVVMSAMTLTELYYGASVITDAGAQKARMDAMGALLEVVPVVPFDSAAALVYTGVRRTDEKRESRVFDRLIAAHAIALNLILVTNNIKDFQKFRPALRVENWTVAKR